MDYLQIQSEDKESRRTLTPTFKDLLCEHVGGGRTCLSCSGVVNVSDCDDVETCRDDELCHPENAGGIFGKRLTGHHMVCQTCCNTTNICNMKSSCVAKLAEHSSCGSTGNDSINQISTSTSHRLSIYIEDFKGNFAYANYLIFNVGDEHRKYQLGVCGFSGTNGLSMF
ncbi:Hypothetical predicted protein [Mytilus galloprovincialis]|uniref:Fibrinogen C-terminal domain-containing protein n=1 Tax=Mytilus galloprovincialis TaxID=29158 RepID=A0A8B6C2Z1_MYTGA|nr:Hypothetical predicted protein [Mytilus galloprovincialis]